jgi:hypothetical protein
MCSPGIAVVLIVNERRTVKTHLNPTFDFHAAQLELMWTCHAEYTTLTVFDSREITYEYSDATFCGSEKIEPPYRDRWDAGGKQSVLRGSLSVTEFESLTNLIDCTAVRALRSFLNPITPRGAKFDFRITIPRPSGSQVIPVWGFSPRHAELTALICHIKAIIRALTESGEIPPWCKDSTPVA